MRVNLFPPILVLFIFTLLAKAFMLLGRLQEQTTYGYGTSIIVDTAYAKNITSSPESIIVEKKDENIKTNSIKNNIDDINIINDSSGNLTKSEIALLKKLSKRREKLEERKREISAREKILKATEGKIDQKLDALKILQSQLEKLMKQYEKNENKKILSLVKIYENMKPKNAAKIFSELEMPVLIKVVSNMKEVKVAPIIANMEAKKARDLSIELARQENL